MAEEILTPTTAETPLILGAGASYKAETYRGYKESKQWGAIPLVVWEDERFFVRGVTAGWKAINNEHWEVAAVLEYRDEGYDSSDADILAGMDDRDPGVDAGAQVSWKNGPWGLRGTVVADVSGASDGAEARGEFSYTHVSENRRWIVRPSAALVYQNDNLVDYYYGVKQSEAIPVARPAYEADDALIYRFQLASAWNPGGSKLQLIFGGRFDLQTSEYDNSPITDTELFWMGFIAAGYRFD
jgi:outer membrane protein